MTATFGLSPAPALPVPVSPTILHAFSPGVRGVDQIATWELIQDVRTLGTVEDWPCDDAFDYHSAVVQLWGRAGDLLLIEQDNAPTLDQVRGLLACPEPCCTIPYWITPASSGLSECIISIGVPDRHHPIEVERTTHSAIGCIKLAASWRQSVKIPARGFWHEVENSINTRVAQSGQSWHVHWPLCAHHHGGKRYG